LEIEDLGYEILKNEVFGTSTFGIVIIKIQDLFYQILKLSLASQKLKFKGLEIQDLAYQILKLLVF